jgi:hypothetical protein
MTVARLLLCLVSMMWAGLCVSAPAADPAAAAREVVRKESLGGLRLDQPVSEVIKLLGKPEKETKLLFQEADGNYVQTWKYPSKGIELGISAGAKPTGRKSVASITANAPCQLATQRGIKIGSPATLARKTYAAWADRDTPPAPDAFIVASIYGGIIFHFERGQVNRIFFGAAAE